LASTDDVIQSGDPAPVLGDIIDLNHYPIEARGGSAYAALIARSRQALADEGAVTFPGFVRDLALARMVEETLALQPKAFHFRDEHTVYFQPAVDGVDAGHPQRRMVVTEKDTVAYADIPASHPIRAVYQSDAVLNFIKDVLDQQVLYRHADPLAALNLQSFAAGDQLGWHFDRSDFSVTLAIQAPEAGGTFDYVRMLRRAGDECHDAVARFLDDPTSQHVQVLPQVAGTLAMFRGHYALHRVAPVIGSRLRLNAVLAYVDQPDVQFSPYARKLFYGRDTAEPLA
jgi:alkylated DNA repair dioxygenase AlkB